MRDNKSNIDVENTKEIAKKDDKDLNIAGGYRSFFPRWFWGKIRCDSCNAVIDGETMHGLATANGQHICEKCLNNYKNLVSKEVYDDYTRKLLGLDPKNTIKISKENNNCPKPPKSGPSKG